MYRTILLKIQLSEAAKLAKSKDYRKKRLAVVLLDNFVEIQLRTLITRDFSYDEMFYHPIVRKKQWSQDQKNKAKRYFDELLRACTQKNKITKSSVLKKEEAKLLSFCHEIRNQIYHKVKEDKLLIDISLFVLHEIITHNQPKWRNAMGGTVHRGTDDEIDSFISKKRKENFDVGNSKEDWDYFFKKYFQFIDKRKRKPPALLSKFIIDKIQNCEENIEFLESDGGNLFSSEKFNDYVFHFAFFNEKKNEIERIKESRTQEEWKNQIDKLMGKYKKSWKKIDKTILNKFKKWALNVKNLSSYKAIEKWLSFRNQLNLIHNALEEAASGLDKEIQLQIDVMRGK